MLKKYTIRSRIYLITAILGLITAWVLNGIASVGGQNYITAWFGSAVDWVLSIDLLLVGVAVVTFMLVEAKRLGMKRVWLYLLLSGVTAMAFTFPLFMAFRERKLLELRLASGKLERFEFDEHKVDIWVPKDLNPETPVLIMHDGRNVFDEKDSFTGKTWEVLSAIKDELEGPQPLVISVWGLSDETRIRELSPQSISDSHQDIWDTYPDEYKTTGTQSFGDAYVSLVSDAILPFALDKYGISHNPKRTAIMGASMGGLISLYAMAHRPNLYGTAICFSTHWLFGGQTAVKELIGMLPEGINHRVWTDRGTLDLDANYGEFHESASKALAAKGFEAPGSLIAATYPNTGHHEKYWSKRVGDALNWWLAI
jgi:predicted alpha/beta superfamily hydrolase